MISRILYFLAVVFCINIFVVGFGLAELADTNLAGGTLIDNDPGDFQNITQPNITYVDAGDPDTIIESATQPDLIPEVQDGYSVFKTITGVAGGAIFGWALILYLLNLPAIIIYGVLGVIGIMQAFAMFYLTMYIINAIVRGRL